MYFDVAIIGDTQDAWAAADEAAQSGCRTAVLRPDFDGRGTETGIAAVTATFNQSIRSSTPIGPLSPREMWAAAVRCHERQMAHLCRAHSIQTWKGKVRFTDPTTVNVTFDGTTEALTAQLLLIAVGSTSRCPNGVDFDQRTIFVPEDVSQLASAPETLIILGGNRTARAFRRFFECAGSTVTLIDGLSGNSATDCHRGEVTAIFRQSRKVTVRLTSDEELSADALLFAADRVGATSSLALADTGLQTDEDGRLWCDASGNTWLSSIAAAGEVVGFPKRLRDQANAARELIISHFGDRRSTNSSQQQHRKQPSLENRLVPASLAAARCSPTLKIFSERS